MFWCVCIAPAAVPAPALDTRGRWRTAPARTPACASAPDFDTRDRRRTALAAALVLAVVVSPGTRGRSRTAPAPAPGATPIAPASDERRASWLRLPTRLLTAGLRKARCLREVTAAY